MALGTPFRVEMLGRLVVRLGDREIHRFRTQKTAALLAYLAFYKHRSHPRDALIELFWPESPLGAARTNLSVALNALRHQLEERGVPSGTILIADRSLVRLNPDAFVTDVEAFCAHIHQAERETDTGGRIGSLTAALDLYQGDLLPGHYEDWILAEQDRLQHAYLTALSQVVKECAEARRYETAIEYAHRLVQADPLREGAYLSLMRLYLAIGRPAEAIHQFETIEHLLEKELKTAPAAPLRELADRLRRLEPMGHVHQGARAAGSRPTGSLSKTAPSASPVERPASRIPLQFNRCFGREEEIASLAELLSPLNHSQPSQPCRLVTLTGPGGTGKTHLSIEVAWRLREEFSGGVQFVPLEDLDDPMRLGESLRDALDLPRQTQSPALDQVAAYLNGVGGPFLLVLDNLEQIAAGGAPVVWTLLNRVPRLRCLVTSRRALDLPGERSTPVTPLPIPPRELAAAVVTDLLSFPSVALFVDRAQAQRPEFQITPRNAEAIAAICRSLEGIPLAIELAAARARALTPSQILDQLAERFELLSTRKGDRTYRHRSLWAAIDWSYHLLPTTLRQFFARLSVFRGGWTLEAAETVCQEPAALDWLAQLRGSSLVLAEESSSAIRFRMLETLREFAAEQLVGEDREKTRRRHADYFHEWVTRAHLSGSEQLAWYERFEEDLDNLRATLAWSLEDANELEIGRQLAGALVSFWRVRGHLHEGREWYARLLSRSTDEATVGLARALYGAGALASLIGETEGALLLLERSMAVSTALEDDHGQAMTHNELGTSAYRRGDFERARAHYQEYLKLARSQELPGRIASALANLASVAQITGDSVTSRALNNESLAIWRESGDRVGEARALHNLAVLALGEEQLEEARRCFEQSLQIKRDLSDHYGISSSLGGIAEVTIKQGEYAAAFAAARESMVLARAQGIRAQLVDILDTLAELMRAVGESETVVRIYGSMESARETMNYPIPPSYRSLYDQIHAELRQSLGVEIYERLHREGRDLPLEQALAMAQDLLERRFPLKG